MKQFTVKQFGLLAGTVIGAIGMAILPAAAVATTGATHASSADQARLQHIITRGNNEIVRRLTSLNKLSGMSASNTKLSASDKSSLTSEVADEVSSLTSLKTKLDADTDVTTAVSDAQSIITNYRVYALIMPKIELVKTADDQQVTEGKLTALSAKLQSRITADQTAGKNVATLQSELTDLNTKISDAQTISSNIESSVVTLQPSDYNSDHSVLSGDRDQLKTAQTDIKAAVTDAKSIVNGLKNL
jgi:hypothetical protein